MEKQEQSQTDALRSTWDNVFEWIKVIATALLIAIPIRFFIAEPFVVKGASMDPTFETNQFLIVDRLSYRFEKPQRGDVIVFKYPNNPKDYYIKRIIGLPNETMTIKNGVITVTNPGNEQDIILEEPYLDNTRRSFDNYHRITLGETEYFVMGDNRIQSSDSRSWGPLQKNLIVGRPFLRLLPLDTLSIFPGEYHEQKNTK